MVSGIPQEPNNSPQIKGQNYQQQVDKYKASIFNQCDSDISGKLEVKNKKGDNEVKTFNTMVQNFIAKITGKEDAASAVNNATNSPVQNEEPTNFDETGKVIPDTKTNPDGSTDTNFHGENVHGTDNSVSVTGENGKSVGGTRVFPGGIQILEQPDGSIGVFKDGELIVGDEARAIIDSLNIDLKNN